MSPEQARGLPVDQRTDLFALGAILYELLSGRRAFERPTTAETITAVIREDPVSLSTLGAAVIPAIDRIVRRCLEKDPEARFAPRMTSPLRSKGLKRRRSPPAFYGVPFDQMFGTAAHGHADHYELHV